MIEAVRVPPSAWMTSQSMVIWRSPRACRSITERKLRPISRWISTVRPPCLPAEASRRVRSEVARGSMPYSAVTQPRPWPLSQGGSRSSRLAVTSTWVSPNFTKQEPSAYFDHAALERHGAQLVDLSAAWPHRVLLFAANCLFAFGLELLRRRRERPQGPALISPSRSSSP